MYLLYTSWALRINCFVVYINYHVKTSINYVPYPNSYLIMGIRLYPCTDNTANLAVLIDVPQDTFDRLDYIKEQCQEEYTDWYDEYYERISNDEELQKADDFLIYGWDCALIVHPPVLQENFL